MSQTQALSPLLFLIQRNRLALGATYTLSLSEQLLGLLIPWAIGIAINDLLQNNYRGLIIFVLLWSLLAIITVGRKMYDTRVFMGIYARLVAEVMQRQRAVGTTTGKLVARSVLIREIINFFEIDVPDIFAMIISFFGSLLMLTLFDWHITLVAALMLGPVLILNALMWKPINRLNRSINNNLERQTRVIASGSNHLLLKHFKFLRLLRVKTSDIEARTWGLIEVLVVAASIYIFIYTASIPAIQAGTIFAIITYFWQFQESLDRLPILMQSVSRVKDILQRIQHSDALSK